MSLVDCGDCINQTMGCEQGQCRHDYTMNQLKNLDLKINNGDEVKAEELVTISDSVIVTTATDITQLY